MRGALDILAGLVSALPEGAALRLARGLGWLGGSVIRHRRRDALEALRRAFPGQPETELRRIADRMYAGLALNAVEMLRLERGGNAYARRVVEWHGREHLDRARSEGRGVLLLSAHTGNWELAITALPALGYPTAVVVKRIKNRGLDERIVRIRRQFGLRVLPARGAYRDCLRALRRNELLGFVLDQNMTRDEGVFVEFFGRSACTTLGLAHLAATSGAPVVPFFMERLDATRHRMNCLPALPPPENRGNAALSEATQRYTRLIEDFVRAHPEQWIWIHRRWKTRPLTEIAANALSRDA